MNSGRLFKETITVVGNREHTKAWCR